MADTPFLAKLFALFFLLSLSLGWVPVAGAAASSEGPYLTALTGGQWLARWADSSDAGTLSVREQRLKIGERFEVGAVGACPAFQVQLREPAPTAPNEIAFSSRRTLFLLADTHGEYEILCGFLQKHGVVDSSLHWAFGRGQLVVLGDIFDRGPNQTEILWWLYQLQAEAQRAGGGVQVLLGNHEVMALRGDARYLNPKYPQVTAALGAQAFAELFAPSTVLGQWLRTRSTVLKANHVLCMHGGLSREIVDQSFSLSEINSAVRAALADGHELTEREKLVIGPNGPQWYRGYFAEQKDFQTATDDDIGVILKTFKAQTIAVGHTIVPTVTPLYNNRVIAVQVYPHRDEQSHAPILEGAVLTKGRWMRAGSDGQLTPLF